MKYCYREQGSNPWFVTESLKSVPDPAEVYILSTRLTPEVITVTKHEEEVAEAEKEVRRAEERMRSAEDRLRIQRLKTGIA